MEQLLISIDIGTTSTKGILYNQHLTLLASENRSYPLYQDASGMAEQDPDQILNVVLAIIQELSQAAQGHAGELAGISFSSAMHSLILLDQDQQPLTRALTWLDKRAATVSDALKRQPLGQEFYMRTGTPIHPMSPLVKLAWLRQTQPALMEQTAKVVGIKEYVCWHLCGEFVTDYSLAAATGLLSNTTLDWDPVILDYLGLNVEQLPAVVAPQTRLAEIKTAKRQELGLAEGVALIIGGSDGAMASLGSGAEIDQAGVLTIGTSAALRLLSHQPYLDPAGRTFCYALGPHLWLLGGASNNGGNVLQWAKDLVDPAQTHTFQEVLTWASQAEAGATGLTFLPHLGGERAPLWTAESRGHLMGLNLQHQPQDILRAALEGILYNVKEILTILEGSGLKLAQVFINGGFFQSELTQALAADILAKALVVPENIETSCLGAALVGYQALGLELKPQLATTQTILPSAVSAYEVPYQRYQRYCHLLNS